MSTKRAPCPVCNRGPRDTALALTTDEHGTVAYCHRCGYTQAENFERRPDAPPPVRADNPVEWSERAESIWRRTVSLRRTVGQTYLEHRGCRLPPAGSDLRFLEPTDKHPPSLCARITDAVSARPLTLHFTRLAPDGRGKAGTERDKLLLAGHRKRGGVIRLWPNEAVTLGLAIGEGIETCLAAAHLFSPVWATVDCGNLERFPVLGGIDALTIFADHDQAGTHAATACSNRWREAAREVRVLRARRPGADVAELTEAMMEDRCD